MRRTAPASENPSMKKILFKFKCKSMPIIMMYGVMLTPLSLISSPAGPSPFLPSDPPSTPVAPPAPSAPSFFFFACTGRAGLGFRI